MRGHPKILIFQPTHADQKMAKLSPAWGPIGGRIGGAERKSLAPQPLVRGFSWKKKWNGLEQHTKQILLTTIAKKHH